MQDDLVNNPKHYKNFGFESIDLIVCVIELMPIKNMAFHIGNAIKYTLRSKFKGNEIQDLSKASWYITHCKTWVQDKEFSIFEQIEVMKYLSLVSRKDFKLYILLVNIVTFALNPSQRNFNALEKNIKRYIKEKV
ncbi:DUF3310 domain-containing protein [Campylobacter sp. CCS1377]|uniref:DUF3310 domain-containing protein n=1 Tax=Campylobacter sp. CCS1377 TaxID=3158229 RepID=A0AAU7E6D9_9BACT